MSDPDSERRSLSRGEWAAVVVAILVVGATAWVWLRKPAGGPAAPAAQPAADAAGQQAAGSRAAAPVALSDAQLKKQLESLSADPAYRRWLAGVDDVARRWATLTDNLAEGVSPRKVLGAAGPKAPFKAMQRGERTVIAPESYARYDEFATAVASVNAQAFASVYRAAHPAVELAYQALGYPNGSLDEATARALRRIEGAPVVDGDVELVQERSQYRFADPALEEQHPVEKHLLRMGPRNTRLIQAKARQLRETLGFPSEAPAPK